jgi:Holliday junction DNA helicase RuvB
MFKPSEPSIQPDLSRDDVSLDQLLRPSTFADYVGQDKIKTNLQTIIGAAQKRKEVIDHILLYGQAGLGKTTLAMLIAKELGSHLRMTSGPSIEKAADLATILSGLEAGDVLFVDEIHRLNKMIEEMLYPAMESRVLHLVIGKGPAARMISLDLPPFTLIAATTRANLLSGPLRSRFGATFRIDYYSQDDISQIINRSANLMGLSIQPEAVALVASSSRFTPRTANRLLRRVRDVMQMEEKEMIDTDVAQMALDMFEIDSLGLEDHDRRLLKILVEKFNGGPVGLSTLAAALSEDKGTIEDVYEPYLLKMGLLARTASGRVATSETYKHLGISKEKELF